VHILRVAKAPTRDGTRPAGRKSGGCKDRSDSQCPGYKGEFAKIFHKWSPVYRLMINELWQMWDWPQLTNIKR
jgi:hypothetical protein